MRVFFACCEFVLQTILKIEKRTGRPSYGLCIFDMGKVALTNHINPNSNCNKVFKARALIWESFYPGMIKHIAIANPPMMLTVVWSVAKFLLADKQRQLLNVCRNTNQLKELVGSKMLPVAFGGELMDEKYTKRDDCCNDRKEIKPQDYFVQGSILKEIDIINLPEAKKLSIKANSKHRILCTPKKHNDKYYIAWKFTTSDQIQFSIHQSENLVYPSLKIVTTEIPEEDYFEGDSENTTYSIEFLNTNRFMPVGVELQLVAGKITNENELSVAA